jgi:signal peptidase I
MTMRRLTAITVVATAVAVLLVACNKDAKVYSIPSCAMSPTVQTGGKVAVRTSSEPGRGNVVVYRAGDRERVSRVVAVGGDRVESTDGRLVVNSAAVDEPYLAEGMTTAIRTAVDVPKGSVFLLGDNRTNSQDSRFLGPLPVADVIGKATVLTRGDGC